MPKERKNSSNANGCLNKLPVGIPNKHTKANKPSYLPYKLISTWCVSYRYKRPVFLPKHHFYAPHCTWPKCIFLGVQIILTLRF